MQSRTQAPRIAIAHTSAQPLAAHPLALLAVPFALGILGGPYLAIPISIPISSAGLSTLFAVAALLRRQMNLTVALGISAMLFLGPTLASIEKDNVPNNQLKRLLTERTTAQGSADDGTIAVGTGGEGTIGVGEPVEITGVLEREPEVAPERLYLFLRVEKLRLKSIEREVSGEVVLLAPVSGKLAEQEFLELDLRYGARVRVMTNLERSDSFRNPGVSSFTEYLDRKGYDATGFIKSPLLIERLENTRVFLPLAWLYEWRRKLQAEIDSRFSFETAGVLNAAFLGNRYNLSHSTAERFREGGTFHVLVISGLHITFLGGLVFLIAKRLTRNRALQFLFPVVVLWSYSVAVGADPSVVRAALMFTVVLLAPLVSRRASSLNALGGVGIALLVWRPSDLLDPSFQLTFVSVLAIVTLAWPLLQKLSDIGSWRPTRETPYPPSCAPWLRSFCESLFWSERRAQRELEKANYSYRLFKTPMVSTLERLHLQRLLRYGFGAVVVSSGVQLALLPFLVIYFHRLSLASFLLNIGVSILMGAVAATAVAGLVIAQLSFTLAGPFISAANALNSLMVHSVDPFAKIGAASIRLPEYKGWGSAVYVLYYVPLTILAVSLWRWTPLKLPESDNQTLRFFANPLRSLRLKKSKRKNLAAKNQQRSPKVPRTTGRVLRLALWAQIAAVALIVFHPWSEGRPERKLRIDFLDVGQGDAALVTFPDNTTLLIDGGGRPGPFKGRKSGEDSEGEVGEQFERDGRSIGESVVSEYLWWRGLNHIDYILATHADADHLDGLNDVARNFTVRAALVARTPSRDLEYSRFSETLSTRGIPIRVLGAGDEMKFGNVSVSVLWPIASMDQNASSGNNHSLVLRLEYGDRSILLTGDIEAPAENAMLKTMGSLRERLRADIVKVAHHGSKSSSTEGFIAATRPSFAIISVGKTSVFGHPNRAVVERWESFGSQVLTTGISGTITVTTDGEDLKVEHFIAAGDEGPSAQQPR
ncbi:MAG: ComEC/Rec2 family competence protein [Pyrinomonadaceae bacterium]